MALLIGEVKRKVPVSVRLDPQVLDYLRAKGEGPRQESTTFWPT
jgi:hypothetical protein